MKLTPDRKAWKHWRRAVSRRIKASPDQQFLFATGYHPPMVRGGASLRCVA